MRALRALGAGVTLGPLPSWRTSIALRTLGTAIPRVTLRALPPFRASAVLDVAGAVLIHVLGGEVTRAVLVQIPAMQTMSALRALVTLGALRAGVAFGTLGAGISRRTLRAGRARVALRPLRARCAVIPPVASRTLRAGRTSAVLDVAGAVVIHVLDGEVTRAVLVQIPAMQTGSARRALVTLEALRTGVALGALRSDVRRVGQGCGRARAAVRPLRARRAVIPPFPSRTLLAVRTSAVLDVAGAVVIHVLDGEVTRAVLVQIPAMQPGSARRALVTLEALRTGVALGALRTGVAFGTLRAGISRRSLRTRITRRTLRSGRTSAIQNRALPISVHILRRQLAPSIGVQIPAIDSVRPGITSRTLRSPSPFKTDRPHRAHGTRRPGWTARALRPRRPHRSHGTGRPGRTAWTQQARRPHRPHRAVGARRTGRTRPPHRPHRAGGTRRTGPEPDLNFSHLALRSDGIPLGAPANSVVARCRARRPQARAAEPDQSQRQCVRQSHAIYPFAIVCSAVRYPSTADRLTS